MDIKQNYHSHTSRCGHAVGTDRDYIENAIAAGFEIYGFSDHIPYETPNDRERMRLAQAEDYLQAVAFYRDSYRDRIRICCGMELEYYPSELETILRFRKKLDYCILGQHYLELDAGSCYELTRPEQLRAYTDRVVSAMEQGLTDYVAHPDLPMFGYPQWDDACREMAERICRASLDYDIPLELNTGAIRFGKKQYADGIRYAYPTRPFFAVAESCRCKIMVGLDLHNPDHIPDRHYREEALAVVEGLKLNFCQNEDILAAAARRKQLLFGSTSE